MNERKDIDQLLEKYFEGETSLLEEEILRNYFAQSPVDEPHKMYAPLFGYFAEKRNAKIGIEQDEAAIRPIKKAKKIYFYALGGLVASIAMLLMPTVLTFSSPPINDNESIAYIDGKKISSQEIINSQALIAIENMTDIDTEAMGSQIDALDSFTE